MAERDRAPVDVHSFFVETELSEDDEALRREGFVQLDEVDLACVDPDSPEELPHGRHRPDAHHAWIDSSRCATDERAERLEIEFSRPLLTRDHERGRTIVDAARVPGGHRAVSAEGSAQTRKRLERRVRPRMLVDGDVAHWDELVREASGFVSRSPALLRAEGERILVSAGQAVTLGDVLARLAHRLERE